ncbi:GNAT family N-acetyltransferase [Patescibacteria group bacterium]|nr:MAG: GNAT family N-acetyltransferase [Patescibacteria group bacterium]
MPRQSVKVRGILAEDLDNICKLYNDNFPLSPWSKKSFQNFLNDQNRSPLSLLIKDSGKIAGFVLGRCSKTHPEIFNLNTLLVTEAQRGKGYARVLIEKLVAIVSKNENIKQITVHFRDNNQLESFYSRLGFSGHQIIGTYSDGEAKHQMEIISN